MTVEEFARKLLEETGCDEHTYGSGNAEHLMDDLKDKFPDGMPESFTYLDVANAILSMSRPRPITRRPYRVYWSNDSCCGAAGSDSLEDAVDSALGVLSDWVAFEMSEWEGDTPTQKDVDSYNCMLDSCWVDVRKYNPKTDDYDTIWTPSKEDEESVGWKEIAL